MSAILHSASFSGMAIFLLSVTGIIGAVQDTPGAGTTSVTASVTGTTPDKIFVRTVATQD